MDGGAWTTRQWVAAGCIVVGAAICIAATVINPPLAIAVGKATITITATTLKAASVAGMAIGAVGGLLAIG